MEDDSIEETVVVRYLLGDLPEEAQVQVEDRAFSDPEYLRLIEAVEADLIDSYVQGEMSLPERQQFESRFLASPQRQKKVEFARALARVAGESKPVLASAQAERAPTARYSWREALAQILRGRSPAFQFAMAAIILILAVVASWEVVQTVRLHGDMNQLEAERRLQQQREQVLQQQINQEHARAEELAAQMQQQGGHPAVASLMLLPGIARTQGSLPELVIPGPAQLASIQIQLEPRDVYPRFRAELRNRSGDEILTRANLRAQRSSTGRAVVLEVPASALNPGDYELALKGVSGEEMTDIGYYNFSVRKK